MTQNGKMSSYGLYLQTVRVEKGISIDQVAEESRIRAEILRSIEAEDHAKLPDDVFVKGFLRIFAQVIGADPEEAVRRFDVRRKPVPAAEIHSSGGTEKPPRLWLTLLWIAALMIGLVGGTLVVYQMVFHKEQAAAPHEATMKTQEDRPPAEESSPADTPAETAETAEKAETAETMIEATPPQTKAVEKRAAYALEIVCHEDTWLKIIADDARATEHQMKPGDKITLNAETMFNLLIGNAGGISVQLNGQPVPVPGGSGQVVNLQLP
jgi:cytoskeletal protein RodZ